MIERLDDKDIRHGMRVDFASRTPPTAFIDEIPVYCYSRRADVVGITDHLHGFEIKGSHDTFRRLPQQVHAYDLVFDLCSLVTVSRKVEKAKTILPDHWGIVVASLCGDSVLFEQHRPPKPNPRQEPLHLLRLLWKDELAAAMRQHGIRVKSRDDCGTLWHKMLVGMTTEQIRASVCEKLIARIPGVEFGRAVMRREREEMKARIEENKRERELMLQRYATP